MLIAGELAVRWVAEIEATASTHAKKSNFKFTSRTQVSIAVHALRWRIHGSTCSAILVAAYRAQHAEHRGFGAEPPSQARPPTCKPSGGVDDLWCVSRPPQPALS